MEGSQGLVSIVIPAYNAGQYLNDTIQSIISQSCQSWEIIVVNDGSTDNTSSIVDGFNDQRIKLICQDNSGVSIARNNGLTQAKGEFIVFFDADDVMTPEFLEVRVNVLNTEKEIGFVGGWVESFPAKTRLRRATAEDPEKDIHFFNAYAATIPSNYMFRTAIIRQHGVTFHPLLNSSADRFFLLQLVKHTKGKSLDDEKGKLLYRISETSMSHHVTPKLIHDYYRFYNELNNRDLLPQKKRREIKTRYLFSIASSFSLIKNWGTCGKLLFRSFLTSPVVFFKLATNKKYRNVN